MKRKIIKPNDVIYSQKTAQAISSILLFLNEVRLSLDEKEIYFKNIYDLYSDPEYDQYYLIGYELKLHNNAVIFWFGCWIRLYEKHGLPIHIGVESKDPKTRQEYYDKFEQLCHSNSSKVEKVQWLEGYPVAAVKPEFLNYFNNFKEMADLLRDFTIRL